MKLNRILIVVLMLCGCQSRGPNHVEAQNVSKDQALQIAKQNFSEVYPGRLSSYEISVSGDYSKDDWYVLFTGTEEYARPGGYTPILVNKASGEVKVLGSK
jgi:hypothetical protein